MIKTITLYDGNTGKLGPIYTGTEEELGVLLTYSHLEGAYDSMSYKVNLETRSLEEVVEPRKPLMHELRNKRNDMLDNLRWTIMPDSPLSNQEEWLLYLKALQNLLVGITPETTDQVIWPEKPEYIYI